MMIATTKTMPCWGSVASASVFLQLLRSAALVSAAAVRVAPRDNTTLGAPTVTLANGSYYGVYSDVYAQDYFLGMPFAQPPLDDLRFRPPQSLDSTWTEARNATAYQPECIGYGSDQWILGNFISEDCLSVNVIRPHRDDEDDDGALLPVAIFFNPGGWYEGGNADPRYNMSFLVQQSVEMGKPFVAVSPNYRLSMWGFLYGQEVVDAGMTNLGMLDQRLALHWVQENIARFGGDPAKVTIWGESAGGGSVGAHLVAYGGRDDKLFRAAISQSGFCSGLAGPHYPTIAEWQPIYDYIVDATNCTDAADTLACLRTVPTAALSAVFNSTVNGTAIGIDANFAPQIDGVFLQASGSAQLKQGRFVRVPYLLGANFDEGASFGTRGINTTAEFAASIRTLLSTTPGSSSGAIDNATVDALVALYPDDPALGIPATLDGRPSPASGYGAQWKREAAMVGDVKMHAARRLAARSWAAQGVPAYSYHWDVLVHGATAYQGAGHYREVAFVFADTLGVGYQNAIAVNPFEDAPETFFQLSEMMARMWVSFIVDLDPNHSGVTDIEWPIYTLDNPTNLAFDVNVTGLAYHEQDDFRADAIDFIIDNLDGVLHM